MKYITTIGVVNEIEAVYVRNELLQRRFGPADDLLIEYGLADVELRFSSTSPLSFEQRYLLTTYGFRFSTKTR